VPIIVKLPNGKHVNATHKGTVKIPRKLFLQDALYIPNFSYNLISISKLVSSHNLELIFSSKSCIIQYIKTKEIIDIVEVEVGLYAIYLRNNLSCYLNTTTRLHS